MDLKPTILSMFRTLREILEVTLQTAFSFFTWVQVQLVCLLGGAFFGVRRRTANGQGFALGQVKRVLIVRLDGVGDVVMSTSFLRELRRLLPSANITLVVKPGIQNLVELCPHVNEILVFNQSTVKSLRPFVLPWRIFRFAYRYFRNPCFDLAVLPKWSTDGSYASYMVYLSRAEFRVAYSAASTPSKRLLNNGFDALFTHVITDSNTRHEVEHNHDVIRFLGGSPLEQRLELWIGPEDWTFAEATLRSYGIGPETDIVALGPSGGHSLLKQWPIQRFVQTAKRMQEMFECRFLVVGGPREEALGDEIESALGRCAMNLVGKTTLRQMAALLKFCRVFVGNDSGPMHIAAAMDIPVVGLFGSSCPHRFGPWTERQSIQWLALPCSPCFRLDHADRCKRCILDRPHCMLDMTVDQVVRAAGVMAGQQRNKIQERLWRSTTASSE